MVISLNRLHKDASFANTFFQGVEGFSKAPHLAEMNLILGGKGEFLAIILFFGLAVPLLHMGRKVGEDSVRSEVKTTNRYARLDLGRDAQLSRWTLGDASKL